MLKAPLILGLSFLFTFVGQVHANAFCTDMTSLVAQARAKFANASAVKPLVGSDTCRFLRILSGGNTYHCTWKFPYRDAAADTAFDLFNQQIGVCFKGSLGALVDDGVNHPDSYRQHQHLLDGAVASVSIKDKGALQETYVFIAIQSTSDD